MADSLYERLGGHSTLFEAMHRLYEKMQNDPVISHYFADMDIESLTRKQVSFMTRAFGGQSPSERRSLKEIHAGLNISNHDFNVLVRLLQETLTEIGIEIKLQHEVMAIIEDVRESVVSDSTDN
ncbi:group I truncated hemoglobin [Kistimonas asteriae]|uniref:group I truncated hemoglobin n=1 Tax=Kistimonas asteriae TaxID=517724 RepID=UPI001BA7F46F|nr:group 1 truncated hemoglobin [Kistimonas asteriae]